MTLKELRLQNKKTAAEVAEVLGVTPSSISNYENGIRSININQVIQLAELFDCTEKDIILAQLKSIAIGKSN